VARRFDNAQLKSRGTTSGASDVAVSLVNALSVFVGVFAVALGYTALPFGVFAVPLSWALWTSGIMLAVSATLDAVSNHFGGGIARATAMMNLIFNEHIATMIDARVSEAFALQPKDRAAPNISADERESKSLALSFLNVARAKTNDPERIPTAETMGLAPRTWQNRINLLRPQLSIVMSGTRRGTFIGGQHSTIDNLITAIETGHVRFNTPLPPAPVSDTTEM
jgi:hypothetical protein